MIFLDKLAESQFGLSLTSDQVAAFEHYAALLIEWNQRFNLTSITAPEDIRTKHFLDSLSLLTVPNLPETLRMMDVGSGAGLPGLALAIVRPQWDITLLEATGKKVNFLTHVIQQLGLKNVHALQGRAEDVGQDPDFRESYDWVVARAVARLPVLVEYLLPLCKVGGVCASMKGETAQTEAVDADFALSKLGGQLRELREIRLPEVDGAHYIILMDKVRATPSEYPRRAGLPAKQPLINP